MHRGGLVKAREKENLTKLTPIQVRGEFVWIDAIRGRAYRT